MKHLLTGTLLSLTLILSTVALADEFEETTGSWYNFETKEFEYVKASTISDFSKYLPPILGAQGLYKTYILMKKPPIEAFLETMKAITEEN